MKLFLKEEALRGGFEAACGEAATPGRAVWGSGGGPTGSRIVFCRGQPRMEADGAQFVCLHSE